MKRLSAALRNRRDERGVEAVAMIIVLPVMFILLLAMVEVGVSISARMSIENVMRDTVRHAAADGGNNWATTHTVANQKPWDQQAVNALYANGKCTFARCTRAPTVDCTYITLMNGNTLRSQVVNQAGDLITCKLTYHYRMINKRLLNSAIGLGTGKLVNDEFVINVSARAETGPH